METMFGALPSEKAPSRASQTPLAEVPGGYLFVEPDRLVRLVSQAIISGTV